MKEAPDCGQPVIPGDTLEFDAADGAKGAMGGIAEHENDIGADPNGQVSFDGCFSTPGKYECPEIHALDFYRFRQMTGNPASTPFKLHDDGQTLRRGLEIQFGLLESGAPEPLPDRAEGRLRDRIPGER